MDTVTAGTHDALLALQEDAVAAGLDPAVVQLHRAWVRAHMDGEGGGHALILGGDGDVAGLAVLIGHQCGLAVLIQVGNGGIGDTPDEAVGAVGVVLAGEGKAVGLQIHAGQVDGGIEVHGGGHLIEVQTQTGVGQLIADAHHAGDGGTVGGSGGDGGDAGGLGSDQTVLVHGGHVVVAAGPSESGLGIGVEDQQLLLFTGEQEGGGIGQGQGGALEGVGQLHQIGGVVVAPVGQLDIQELAGVVGDIHGHSVGGDIGHIRQTHVLVQELLGTGADGAVVIGHEDLGIQIQMLVGDLHPQGGAAVGASAQGHTALIQLGSLSIDVHREGQGIPDIAALVIGDGIGGDGVVVLAVRQGAALVVRAVPGVRSHILIHGGGNGAALRGHIDGLGDVGNGVAPDLLPVGVGDGEVQGGGAAHLADVDKFHAVHIGIAVGGDGDMPGLQGGFLCPVHGHGQIGAQTIGKAAGEVCAQLGRELAVRHGILIEHSGVVQHTGGGPVAVVGQEGDGQICAAILGGEHHETLHIDAVFIGGVQLALLALGEGDADLHVAGGPGSQRHGLVAGNGDIQRLIVAAHVGLAVLLQHGGGHGDDGHVILGGVLAHVSGVEGQAVAAVLGNIVPQIQHGLGVAVLVGIGVEYHIAGGGGGQVNEAAALQTGGVGELRLRVNDRGGSGHHQVLRHGGGIIAAGPVLGHVGLHQNAGTGHIGAGHGGAAHGGVITLALDGGDGGVIGMFGVIIVHQNTDGVLPQGVLDLGDEGDGLAVFVGTAALHHSDLAGDVDALVVGIGAVTGNHDIVIGGGQIVRYVTVYLQERNVGVQAQEGGLAVSIGVLLVAQQHIVGVDLLTLHAGDGQVGGVHGGGGHHHAVVGVPGEGSVGTVAVHIAGGGLVAGGSDDHNAGGIQLVVHVVDEGVLVHGEAAVGAQTQVHGVHAQTAGILQSRQNGDRGGARAAVVKDLHGDDLSVGSHTGEGDGALAVHGIAGGDAGHMGAVLQICCIPLAAGGHLSVLTGVVKGEGDLGAEIHIVGGDTGHQGLGVEVGRLQNTADVVLGEFGVCRGVGKGGMGGIQPGIQHGDGHALTGELIGGQRHLQGLRIGLLHGGQGVGACHEGTADALGGGLFGCGDAGGQRLGRQHGGSGLIVQLHQNIHHFIGVLRLGGHLLGGVAHGLGQVGGGDGTNRQALCVSAAEAGRIHDSASTAAMHRESILFFICKLPFFHRVCRDKRLWAGASSSRLSRTSKRFYIHGRIIAPESKFFNG